LLPEKRVFLSICFEAENLSMVVVQKKEEGGGNFN